MSNPPRLELVTGFNKELQNKAMFGLLPYRLMGIFTPYHHCIYCDKMETYLTHEMAASVSVTSV